MATVTSGVYPVFNNVFKIGTKGRSSTAEDNCRLWDIFFVNG